MDRRQSKYWTNSYVYNWSKKYVRIRSWNVWYKATSSSEAVDLNIYSRNYTRNGKIYYYDYVIITAKKETNNKYIDIKITDQKWQEIIYKLKIVAKIEYLSCVINIWETCTKQVKSTKNMYYHPSYKNTAQVKIKWETKIEVKWEIEWNAYVYFRENWYTKSRVHIKVKVAEKLIEKDLKVYKNAGYSYLRLRWYTVESTNSEILNLYSNNWYVRYRWKKLWKTTLLLRKNWKLKYRLNIEVVEKKKLILEWWRTPTLYLNKEKKLKILSWNGGYNTKYIYPKWFLETKIIKENNKDYLVLKLKEIPKYKWPRLYLLG